MSERRFTDKQVALILRRASDLEKGSSGSGTAPRGLTLADLQEIAAEAGINPDLIGRAVAEMEGPRGLEPTSVLLGPDTARREVRSVEGELGKEKLAELLRLVDDQVDDQGTVAEALGFVRWTSKGRFRSTQVSLEPTRGETLIRVEERYSQGLRGILHGIPTAYGAMFGLVFALEGLNLGLVPGSFLTLAGAVGGWGIGASIWRLVSSRSRIRVQKFAEKLGLKAKELAPPSSEEGRDPTLLPSGDENSSNQSGRA